MKIGILTQPLHNNYGGLLQNYALQQVLKGMGHEVETMDWMAKTNTLRRWLGGWKERVLYLIDKTVELPRYQPTTKEMEVISQNTHRFIKKYISVCHNKAATLEDFGVIAKENAFEAFVVGSDQVWRPKYNPLQLAMFLAFTEELQVKRVAYAASFGTTAWEFTNAMTKECSRLVKAFNLVTVREKSGVDLCREKLGVKAIHVLDPTMLLNREDYERLVESEKEPVRQGTLFHYILDPSIEKKALIEQMAADNGLVPFTIMPQCQAENRTRWDVKHKIEDCVYPSVTSWLRGFMDAKMIVVDSFHGAVFSIIFSKPFWVVANAKRGNARFESLLGTFGLENRMISIENIGNNSDWNKPINWKKVNSILETESIHSKTLLYNVLNQK